MALREGVAGAIGPQFEDPAVGCLQLLVLSATLTDGTLVTVSTYQDDHGWGLWPLPRSPIGKVLADHRRLQQCRYEAHGTIAEDTGFVFAWPDGRPIRPGWLTHRFTALVAEHGLPPVRLHDLRHGTAMNALHGSASLHTVQHLLGHSSHAFTADVYGTVPDALARAEAKSTAETILTAIRQAASTDAPERRAGGRRRQPRPVRIVREHVRRPAISSGGLAVEPLPADGNI